MRAFSCTASPCMAPSSRIPHAATSPSRTTTRAVRSDGPCRACIPAVRSGSSGSGRGRSRRWRAVASESRTSRSIRSSSAWRGATSRYLDDAHGPVSVRLGDGRQLLEREPDGRFDLLLIDAFNSDAIPMHLLTEEAIALYLRKLKPGGLLVMHISNRYADLSAVSSEAGVGRRACA